MKTNLRIIAVVIGTFMLNHSMVASAVGVAPRISDREIIEALVEIRGTLKAQEQKTDQQFKAMDQQFKAVDQQFKAVDQQFKAMDQKTEQQFKAQEQKTDQQFKAVDQQFKAMDQKMEQQFKAQEQKTDQQFKAVDQQFKAMDQKMEQQFKAMDQKMELKFQTVEHQFKAVDQQISSLTNMLLTFFGAIISLIVALFGYIAWDRRTMVKPLQEHMERIELELHRDLEIQHPEGSRITRFLNALRDLAESDERVAVVLRAHALL